jgi:hypothetical protein
MAAVMLTALELRQALTVSLARRTNQEKRTWRVNKAARADIARGLAELSSWQRLSAPPPYASQVLAKLLRPAWRGNVSIFYDLRWFF